MRISRQILRRYIDVPEDVHALRMLLDDVGLEVKRFEQRSLVGRSDVFFDLEILANRGDHYCYVGIARELRGRTGKPLTLPETAPIEVGEAPFPLRVESDLCLAYSLTLLTIPASPANLPADVTAPLEAAGIHTVSPIVDATNLTNIEFGQPTHAFDADTIVGPVTVRLSRPGEMAWPLFQAEKVALPEGTLVIADDEKVLAIAGVIGCEESKATAGTRRLLLESATFDPVSVRRTSRALDIRTDSSVRFERGGDPTLPLVGAGRVVYLAEKHCGAKRVGAAAMVTRWNTAPRTTAIDPATADKFLNLKLSPAEITERLERYDFRVSGAGPLTVTVPPHRLWDVEGVADIYEELAKSVGYGEIVAELPPLDKGSSPSHEEQVRATVDDVLVGQGFYEVYCDSFYGPQLATAAGVDADHPLSEHVQVLNAIDKGFSYMKNNALVQLVAGVGDNLRMSVDVVKMYEWTRTFHPDLTSLNGLSAERQLLAAIVCGPIHEPEWGLPARESDAWHLKGVLNEIGVALKLPIGIGPVEPTHALSPLLHPNRQATVMLRGKVVGVLGEVHPEVVRRLGIKRKGARPCYLEIETAALNGPSDKPEFHEPPDRPYADRDLAFLLPYRVEAGRVAEVLRRSGPDWLHDVRITDSFSLPEPAGARAITFRLLFSSTGKARTAEELNEACQQLIAAVEREFGAEGVRLRA